MEVKRETRGKKKDNEIGWDEGRKGRNDGKERETERRKEGMKERAKNIRGLQEAIRPIEGS